MDRSGDPIGGLSLHPGHQVGVAVEGELRAGMAEPFADYANGHACLHRNGGMGMS